jgi:hypothetical protein
MPKFCFKLAHCACGYFGKSITWYRVTKNTRKQIFVDCLRATERTEQINYEDSDAFKNITQKYKQKSISWPRKVCKTKQRQIWDIRIIWHIRNANLLEFQAVANSNVPAITIKKQQICSENQVFTIIFGWQTLKELRWPEIFLSLALSQLYAKTKYLRCSLQQITELSMIIMTNDWKRRISNTLKQGRWNKYQTKLKQMRSTTRGHKLL